MACRHPLLVAIDSGSQRRELPVHIRNGLQTASGWMDLVLEAPDGWILIDHKTFPGPAHTWVDKAKSYLPQLQMYAFGLRQATKKPVLEAWIHMPLVGRMVGFSQEEIVISTSVG